MPQHPVHSPGGTISVLTTERGLPVALRLAARALTQPPPALAADIRALGGLAAARAQAARRRDLLENGCDAAVVRNLALASDDDVARAETEVAQLEEELPSSWQRRV